MRRFREGQAHVEVWQDVGALSGRAAELFAETARQAAHTRGKFTVTLAGGSTPRALYELLAGDTYAARVPWESVHVFWSDERCVPPTSDESNYRMAYEALLERVGVPAGQIHRMRGEDEPHKAARDYAVALEKEFGQSVPRFDLILLGMGEDGHTASLFPGSDALDDVEHLVVAPFVEKLKAHRLTLTFRVINAAASVIFLVAGEAKAETLREVLKGEGESGELPAQRVRPLNGELVWLVDEGAARRLSAPR